MTARIFSLTVAAFGTVFALLIPASGQTIDFETYPDGTPIDDGAVIGTQFAPWGVVFVDEPGIHQAGTVLTAGISLNELEFPPVSGVNVLAEYEGLGLKGTFSWPVSSVAASFTYNWPIQLVALGAAGETLGEVDSAFDENLALSLSGNPPNENLMLGGLGGIYGFEVRFRADPGVTPPSDGAFTMDDLTYARLPGTLVPESGLGWTGAVAVLGLFLARGRFGATRG